MLESEVLDVLIGLVVVYFLLSLVLSTLRELIESVLKSRAVHLEQGIRNMLSDGAGNDLTGLLYHHPLIASLFRGDYQHVENRKLGRLLPNYIPAVNFAQALMDVVLNGSTMPTAVSSAAGGAIVPNAPAPSTPLSLSSLRTAVEGVANAAVKRALIVAIDNARGDISQVQTNIEAWFNSTMERVSGWYRRRTQMWLFSLAILLVSLLNVNTIVLTDHLSQNKALRELLVGEASAIARDPAYQRAAAGTPDLAGAEKNAAAKLAALDLPIGWNEGIPTFTDFRASAHWWLRTVAGLLITAIALTLGAPFWFDLLSKMMTVRSTLKPKESGK